MFRSNLHHTRVGNCFSLFVISSVSNQTNCHVYIAYRNMDAMNVTLKKSYNCLFKYTLLVTNLKKILKIPRSQHETQKKLT